jgi:hypothetical protein
MSARIHLQASGDDADELTNEYVFASEKGFLGPSSDPTDQSGFANRENTVFGLSYEPVTKACFVKLFLLNAGCSGWHPDIACPPQPPAQPSASAGLADNGESSMIDLIKSSTRSRFSFGNAISRVSPPKPAWIRRERVSTRGRSMMR